MFHTENELLQNLIVTSPKSARKKFRDGEATVSEAVAYIRVSKDIYLKDFILYQSEDADFISREQIQKNFNLNFTKRFDNLYLQEEE